MNKILFDQLNSVYGPMWNKADEILKKLKAAGYSATRGFYNNHYIKDGGGFAVEYFPIPVITVAEIGDIGIDINNYWVEIHLEKSRAALPDYPELARRYNLEVYGAGDFCSDFYNTQSDPRETAEKISNSNETMINITFYLDLNSDTDEPVNIIRKFAK